VDSKTVCNEKVGTYKNNFCNHFIALQIVKKILAEGMQRLQLPVHPIKK